MEKSLNLDEFYGEGGNIVQWIEKVSSFRYVVMVDRCSGYVAERTEI